MRRRLAANAGEPGRFSAGSSLMLAGLDGAAQVHRQLASLTAPREDLSPEQQSLALIAECFRLSISRSAIYVLPESFDVHAPDQAKAQPKLFSDAIGRIATLFKGLNDTPFDAKRSLFDVTTVMVASELGRTMRGAGSADRPDRHQPQPVLQLDPDRRQGHPRRHGDRRLRPARREGHGLQGASGARCRRSRRRWACPSTSPR